MDCQTFEKKIPQFISGELEGKALDEFLEHIDACEECKEELSIQFLVTEGLERLESGSGFNLNESLADRVSRAKEHIRVRTVLKKALYMLLLLIGMEIIFAAFMLINY